jgi:hypothetical protein
VASQRMGAPRSNSLSSWPVARSPTESNRLPEGTTVGRIPEADRLCVVVAAGSSCADAFGSSRYACKISSVLGPWLVRTLAVTSRLKRVAGGLTFSNQLLVLAESRRPTADGSSRASGGSPVSWPRGSPSSNLTSAQHPPYTTQVHKTRHNGEPKTRVEHDLSYHRPRD